MCLKFGFVIFWQKDFGAKAAHKMLVKLTPGGKNWQLIYPLFSQTCINNSQTFQQFQIFIYFSLSLQWFSEILPFLLFFAVTRHSA
jgi:hypothetical protein